MWIYGHKKTVDTGDFKIIFLSTNSGNSIGDFEPPEHI